MPLNAEMIRFVFVVNVWFFPYFSLGFVLELDKKGLACLLKQLDYSLTFYMNNSQLNYSLTQNSRFDLKPLFHLFPK